MTRLRALLALLLLALMAGCSSGTDAATGSSTGGAPANGAAVDVATFATQLAAPGTTVLDVRTPAEFASGHLPGAVNIDVQAPDFGQRIGTLAKDKPYAVYCRSGNRSGAAVAQMTDAGFTHTYHLDGGIGAWQQAGREITQ
ncbi:MAG: rhodanese-like domain-containing protein [Micrococcales bacterium]|nr:rhodanese-like domain-containing protein [Micrococcales bacterium]